MLNKKKIKNLIVGFLNVSLCIMIVSSSLHLNEHIHNKNDGYTICAPGCEIDTHHSKGDNCETCLNNRCKQKILNDTGFYNYINDKPILKYIDLFILNKYIIYSFSHSRPPPPLNIV